MSVQGCGWPGPILAVQGTRWDPPWTRCSSITGHTPTPTPTHPDWDKVDTPVHLPGTSLGCERNLEHLEKTHTDMGKTCKLHTHTGTLAGNRFPPSLTSWQGILKKTTLFEDLLHIHFRGANDQRKGTKVMLMFKQDLLYFTSEYSEPSGNFY